MIAKLARLCYILSQLLERLGTYLWWREVEKVLKKEQATLDELKRRGD